MSSKVKTQAKRSAYTIRLDEDRKREIERFRAKRSLDGQKISTMDEALNILIDRGLEAETINV